jgi:hypothetical protein
MTPPEPKKTTAPRAFLTAEWRDLAMLNYEIDPSVLRSRVPHGTELSTLKPLMKRSLIFRVN